MSLASLHHLSREEQVCQPGSPCQPLGPVPYSRGSPWHCPAQPVLWWHLWWHWVLGTGGSIATPAPTGGDASNISRELSTARGAAFTCGIPASRRQLGYFPSVSNAVLAVCPCQTCSGIPPGGVWRLAMGVPGEDMGYWVWLAPADVSAAGCAGRGG